MTRAPGHRDPDGQGRAARAPVGRATWRWTDGRIIAVGSVPAEPGDEVVRVDGDIITAGLVNTHHHFYQWMTRGWAFDCTLFGWLTTCTRYGPGSRRRTWRRPRPLRLGELALSRLHDRGRPPLRRPRRRRLGVRRYRRSAGPASGSAPISPGDRWTSGRARAGCRPTPWSRNSTRSSPRPRRCTRGCTTATRIVVTVAPCSPFSVTPELMTESAALARRLGLRLHTHLAETLDEEHELPAAVRQAAAAGARRHGLDRPGRLGRARHPLRRRAR